MGKLVTDNMRTHVARQFVESFDESSNSLYYVFVGKSLPFDDDNSPPTPNSSIKATFYDAYDNMVFGKKVTNTDVTHMIRRVDWNSGNTYTEFDTSVDDLSNTNYYVTTQEGDDYYVFKCLDNNGNAAVTDQPVFSETSADDEFYQTSDGYQWKYMYKITGAQWTKHATADFIPLYIDANVTANAVNGAIETVRINDGGTMYNSYADGLIKEAAVGGNTLLFSLESGTQRLTVNNTTDLATGTINFKYANGDTITLSGNSTPASAVITSIDTSALTVDLAAITGVAIQSGYSITQNSTDWAVSSVETVGNDLSSNTDFYKNCDFYIRSGTGAGQLRTVGEYIVSGNERRVLLTSPFTTLPDTTSAWEIRPGVTIIGDGNGAEALAVVNTSSNTIASVEIIARGNSYSYGTVTITGNTGATQANTANAYVVLSPPGGHGSNIINELNSRYVGIGVLFSNTESNTIPVQNDYRTFGLLKDPLFANVELTLNTATATSFTDGETVIQYTPQVTNTLIKTFTYTLSRYQTLDLDANGSFAADDNVSFEGKSGTILTVAGNTITIRLATGSDAFTASDKIGDGSLTKTITSISAGDPPEVITANAHGFSNGSAIIFANLNGTALDADTTPTTYYALVTNSTAFNIYTDSGLSTSFDNSSNTVASQGYVSDGSRIHNVDSAAYTFTGNNDPISGPDDNDFTFGFTEDVSTHDLPLDLRILQNGTEKSATSNTTAFTVTDVTLDPASDVLAAEVFTTSETILETDYVGRTSGEVSFRAGSTLRLRNVRGNYTTGSQVKGLTSNTTAYVTAIDRSFDTFNQLTTVTTTIQSTGSLSGISNTGFIEDMLVEQADTNASAYVHSIANTVSRKISTITATNPAVVTTNVAHGYSNTTSVTFKNINGTVIDDTTPTTYYLTTVNSTAFNLYTDSAHTLSLDNSANTAANTGVVISNGDQASTSKTFYLNNVQGIFSESDDLTGTINTFTSNTNAEAKINTRSDPDLVDNSGEVIYVENMQPIQRSNDQNERIKLILEF